MAVNQPTSAKLRELERIAVLEAAALLDTPADATFDRFTRLATTILEVPVALVSLVDRDRQFFKSCVGLSEPWASARETPLSHSFCQHVVASNQPLIVADARTHPLLRDNLAILDLGVIAYLGMPLTTDEGHTLGSFCVIDGKPREWTAREIGIVRDLAALVLAKIQVRLLARRFHDDYQEMRQLQLHRDEMVQMLIHDLRNPLTSFLGGLELAQMGGGLSGQQKEFLTLAQGGGEMLLGMINSILDVSKARGPAIALKRTETGPAALVETACQQMAPLAEKAGVKLVWEAAGSAIVADADKMRRVLGNLVGNAIQHTPAGGTVRVSARPGEGGGVRFTVSDTGCGIPPEAHEQIFEKFGGVKSQRVSGASTGLGLPFSRRVVEAHGGRIWVESEPGLGTSFHFTIPAPSQHEEG